MSLTRALKNSTNRKRRACRHRHYGRTNLITSMPKISEVLGSGRRHREGMGITFGEMLNPTITEDYPDAPPEIPGALSRRPRAAARRKRPGEMRRLLPVRGRLSCAMHLYRSRREYRQSCASAAASATPKSITSITTAAFSADIAWRPAPPTPSPTATASRSPATTPQR